MAGSRSGASATFSRSPRNYSQSGKVRQPLVKATGGLEEAAKDPPKLQSSLDKLKSTKRRCRACQRKDMKLGSIPCQADGIGKVCLENKDVQPATCCVLPEQQRIRTCGTGASDACSSRCSFGNARFVNAGGEDDSHTQTEQKLVEATCNFPVELADAIKRIDSGVLALQLFAEKLEAITANVEAVEDMVPNSVCSSFEANGEGESSRGKPGSMGQTSNGTREFVQSQVHGASKCVNDRLRSQMEDQKANDILKESWKLSQEAVAVQRHHNAQNINSHGLRVSPGPEEVAKKPISSAMETYQENLIQGTLQRGEITSRPRSCPKPTMPTKSIGFKMQSVNRTMAPHRVSSSTRSGSYRIKRGNVPKNISRGRASRSNVGALELEELDEETTTSSFSSGYMSTSQQQATSSSSGYSSTSQQPTTSSPSSTARSSGYSLPTSSSGRTSASSSLESPSTTTGYDDDNSNSSGSSTSWQKPRASPSPLKDTRRKTRRLSTEKPAGRLRRLKEKLGLIFHHQHHHHHHHHHYAGNAAKNKGHQKESMWRNLHHIFGLGEKNEIHNKKQAVDRPQRRKAVVSKNQAGHFHALVEGLMRHVKHSKKSKARKAKRGGGVKLPSKGRVKLGFVDNKKKLRLNQFKKLT